MRLQHRYHYYPAAIYQQGHTRNVQQNLTTKGRLMRKIYVVSRQILSVFNPIRGFHWNPSFTAVSIVMSPRQPGR